MAAPSATGTLTKGKPRRGQPRPIDAAKAFDGSQRPRAAFRGPRDQNQRERRSSSSRRRRRSAKLAPPAPLRKADVEQLLIDEFGEAQKRTPRVERTYRWLVRRAFADGAAVIRTTYGQAATGVGYPTEGNREADRRFQSRIQRPLNDLKALGLISWSGIHKVNGQWRCLEVRLLDTREARERARELLRARICVM